jgi:hypothetical protein
MAEKPATPGPDKTGNPAGSQTADVPAAEKSEGQTASKSKKINKMSLAEVEAKLEDIKGKQGGLRSKYARQLLHKKNLLQG